MKSHGTPTLDVHAQLLAYDDVLEHFLALEAEGRVKVYCNGHNDGGRWIFQILSTEFVSNLAGVIEEVTNGEAREGPVLEVMAGDGRLSEFLTKHLKREVVATDAKDGRYDIAYPKWVERLDAMESIRKYNPSFVLVSWEPYLSTVSLELVETGLPVAWIGNPEMCGHPDLMERNSIRLETPYALSRHDSFSDRVSRSAVYLFNVKSLDSRKQ